MRSNSTKKLAIAAIFVALDVVGSAFVSFPVFGSKCSPTQHMVNVLCAVFLGPGYGVGVAFCASLIRNLVGAGTLMAFPGSMVGALCCGLAYKALRNKNEVAAILVTLAAEMLGNRKLFRGNAIGVDDHLRIPIAVTQVDEDQSAMIAIVPDPTGQNDFFAKFAAGLGVHAELVVKFAHRLNLSL